MQKIDSQEKLKIDFFRNRLNRLLSCTLSQKILSNSMKVEFWEDGEGNMTVRHPEVSNDEIDALLLNFRLIQQGNDLVSIRNISKVVERSLDEKKVEEWNNIRKKLNTFLDKEILPRDLGNVSRRDYIDSILYGVFAHTNLKMHQSVSDWIQKLDTGTVMTGFFAALHTYLEYISEFLPILDDV